GNTATTGIGGGICIFSNGGTLRNCTLAGNQAQSGTAIVGGNVTVDNSIIANNGTGGSPCAQMETGMSNLEWPHNQSACIGGITFADPQLGALADHGGPTATAVPAAAASVVQIGMSCPPTDQTGKARGNPCTVGAVEK